MWYFSARRILAWLVPPTTLPNSFKVYTLHLYSLDYEWFLFRLIGRASETRKKTARKKIAARDPTPAPKPGSLNYVLLSQRKNMIGLFRSVNNALSTFEIRATSYKNVLELGQIEALESRFASRDVLAILPTGFAKIYIYPVFCLTKLSTTNPTASVLVISSLNSIVQEQFSEYEFT